MRRALWSNIVLVVVVAVAVGVSGCRPTAESPAPPAATEQTTSPEPSAAPVPTETAEPSVPALPLESEEVDKLEAELSAIEEELDALDLPGDSDLEDLESELD